MVEILATTSHLAKTTHCLPCCRSLYHNRTRSPMVVRAVDLERYEKHHPMVSFPPVYCAGHSYQGRICRETWFRGECYCLASRNVVSQDPQSSHMLRFFTSTTTQAWMTFLIPRSCIEASNRSSSSAALLQVLRSPVLLQESTR